MPYIAGKPGQAFRTFTDRDNFTGDGSTTAFDMQFAIDEAGLNDLRIYVNDVLQVPTDDYTLGVDDAGDYKRITFTSAPTNGHAIVILNPGTVQGEFSSVADNAITSGKLNVDAITGQTELAEAANNADTLLIHDTSASSLKKITVSNLTAQAGDGLSKTNSTLAVDINGTTELSAGAATGDFLLIYDTSAGVLRKISQVNLLNFPTITSVSPTNLTSGDGTGNYTIVITGTGFTGSTAKLLKSDNFTEISFDSQTVDSDTQITGTIAKSSLSNADEDFGVRVTAGTGLQGSLNQQISLDSQPIWSTASGSLATVFDSNRASFSAITVAAADPESGGDITYTLESGSLPAGLSGSSTSSGYVISGTPSAVGSNTTSTFTIRAADVNSNTKDREFTITINAPVQQSFTSSGTFSVPSGVTAVNVLVVAGGGAGAGGGSGYGSGGGGGAGGLIYRPGFSVTPGGTVTVTVGDGGQNNNAPFSNNPDGRGNPGQDSVFGTLTAKGGGGGGGGLAGAPVATGQNGGSGGGAGNPSAPIAGGQAIQTNQPGDSGTYGFGNPGGTVNSPWASGAGGGGANAAGQNNGPGGRGGGAGKAYTIADGSTPVAYAGGGGGGGHGPTGHPTGGAGGTGGGGRGGNADGPQVTSGTANRGGGGGGGGENPASSGPAGTGGKGIVIVAY